jgi:hypothetical protein
MSDAFADAARSMMLRDYFAAAALQGLRLTLPPLTSSERVATLAYLDADAMLAERAKVKQENAK